MISIILPVYNVQAYIRSCLDDLMAQEYQDFEVLLVDDGSTDVSGDILEEYAQKDARFRIIHQKNTGAAQARNVALEARRGEYITFVDADDHIAPGYLRVMMEDMQEARADIACCAWWFLYEDGLQEHPFQGEGGQLEIWDMRTAMRELLYQRKLESTMWCKLYKASLFEGLRFEPGNVYEDLQIIYRVIARAGTVCYRAYEGYGYLQRAEGVTQQKFSPKKMQLIDVADEMLAFIEQEYPDLRCAAVSRLIRANFHIYLQTPRTQAYQAERRRMENNIKTYRGVVITDKHAKRGTRVAAIMSYFGMGTVFRARSLRHFGKK